MSALVSGTASAISASASVGKLIPEFESLEPNFHNPLNNWSCSLDCSYIASSNQRLLL